MTGRLDVALAACGLVLVVAAVPLAVRAPQVTVDVAAVREPIARTPTPAPGAGAPGSVPRPAVTAASVAAQAGAATVPTTSTVVDVVDVPARMAVADLGLTADVVPVLVTGSGALALPEDPRVLGWWAGGPRPGAAQGAVVLAGHVDAVGFGAGPLAALLRAPLGTRVEVVDGDGSARAYVLAERRMTPKDALPADVFDAGGPPRLVVVTCGGPFDRAIGHYRDNVVLVATPSA